MNSQKTLLLDLDGVLVDMVVPLMQWWGIRIESEDEYPQQFGYDMKSATAYALHKRGMLEMSERVATMEAEEFWHEPPRCFWQTLQPYPGALSFLKYLERGPYDIYIFTAYAGADCAATKLNWIDEHIPEYCNRVLLGRPKHLAAAPNSILIDDYTKNCENFTAAGGAAIMCPRPWNERWNELECFDPHLGRHNIYNIIAQDLFNVGRRA